MLAETTEIFGAEQLLLRRARSREVAEKLLGYVRGYKRYLSGFGGSFDDNPTPGNKDGGITNIIEKSLGAVAKSGTSPLMDVVDYAERIASPGLVFMNTPGYDPVSLTGLAAGGVNLIAFTTGRGSAIGFPTVPVVKIATNSGMFASMRDNMDVNAGRIIDGEASVEEIGREIFAHLLGVASGRKTSSELLGHKEFVPWRIGPVALARPKFVDLADFIVAQAELHCAEHALRLIRRAHPDDRCGDRGMPQSPCDGHFARRSSVRSHNLFHQLSQLQVARQIRFLKVHVALAKIVFRKVRHSFPGHRSGQKSRPHR